MRTAIPAAKHTARRPQRIAQQSRSRLILRRGSFIAPRRSPVRARLAPYRKDLHAPGFANFRSSSGSSSQVAREATKV
jgi:hypothetical protein